MNSTITGSKLSPKATIVSDAEIVAAVSALSDACDVREAVFLRLAGSIEIESEVAALKNDILATPNQKDREALHQQIIALTGPGSAEMRQAAINEVNVFTPAVDAAAMALCVLATQKLNAILAAAIQDEKALFSAWQFRPEETTISRTIRGVISTVANMLAGIDRAAAPGQPYPPVSDNQVLNWFRN